MAERKALTKADIAALGRLLDALEQFRLLRPTMPLHHVIALLRVAMEEGKSIGQYAKESSLSHSSMSRHLLDIGEERREGKPGLGLVRMEPAPKDMRVHNVELTPRGLMLAESLVRILSGRQREPR